jgi:hypothetical protein
MMIRHDYREFTTMKTRLEDEQHTLRRKQKRGNKDPEIDETLQEIAFNLEIAYVDLRLEELPSTASDVLRKDLEGDRTYATLQLDIFHKEKAYRVDPSDQQKREIEAAKNKIQELCNDMEKPHHP